jgi:transposase
MDKGGRGRMGRSRRRKVARRELGGVSGAEGARRASVAADTPARAAVGALAPGQRWSVGRKREVVLRMLRGESLQELSRELAVEVYRLEQWREQALAGLEAGLKGREDDPLGPELDAAKRHIGELSMENELLRERCRAVEARDPLAAPRWRR